MSDLLGLLVSFGFISAVLGLASILLKGGLLSPATARKLVHIGVSHWWLLYLAFIRSPWVGLIGSASFVLINWFSRRRHLFKALEDGSPAKNLGTIWFPVSLFLLILLSSLGPLTRWEAGLGALIMGWGDGMAALVGQRFGRRAFRIFGQAKSLAGTLALFSFSALVTAILIRVFDPGLGVGDLLLRAVAMGFFSVLVELATPWGLDNLSLPLLTALFYHFLAMADWAGAFVLATAFNGLVAWGAYRKRSVDESGAVLGAALGSAILVAGGIPAFSLLAGFFLSSTALERLCGHPGPSAGIEQKGSRRDGLQVLANCGAGALASILYASTGDLAWLAALAASFASANADTWASEIGGLHKRGPRSILTLRPVPAGASGGVSALGFLGSALGAAFIGLVFALAYGPTLGRDPKYWPLVLTAACGGTLGALLDSLLGAGLQAKYSSAKTGAYTERARTEGQGNVLVQGFAWMTNDGVNLVSTSLLGLGAAWLFSILG